MLQTALMAEGNRRAESPPCAVTALEADDLIIDDTDLLPLDIDGQFPIEKKRKNNEDSEKRESQKQCQLACHGKALGPGRQAGVTVVIAR